MNTVTSLYNGQVNWASAFCPLHGGSICIVLCTSVVILRCPLLGVSVERGSTGSQ